MKQLAYNAWVITSAISLSMACFAAFIRIRAARATGDWNKQVWHLLIKFGWIGVAGLILWGLLDYGTLARLDWRTWVFLVAFLVASVGFMGVSLQAAREVAEVEIDKDHKSAEGSPSVGRSGTWTSNPDPE